MKTYKLVIFDVDGTLVTTKSGATFRKSADDWQWLPGRLEKVKSLIASGVAVALATNQGGVAFGYMKAQDVQDELSRMSEQSGIFRDRCYVCFNHPKASVEYFRCDDISRKPGPGLLWQAMHDVDILPDCSLMVGDRPEDEQAANAAGVDFVHADEYFK